MVREAGFVLLEERSRAEKQVGRHLAGWEIRPRVDSRK